MPNASSPFVQEIRQVLTILSRRWSPWRSTGSQLRRRRSAAVDTQPLEARILLAGEFTDQGNLGLSNLAYSSVAWGDYDSDGDLDALLTGKESGRVSKIFRNDSGSFTDINASLTAVERSAVAWGDYDNDGDLDILLVGSSSSGYVSQVYRNDSGTFTDISAGLVGVKSTGGRNVAWGDYDNDGDLDILLTGSVSLGNYTSRIYRNENGSFTDITAGLPGVGSGTVEWGDYDNDGDLDFVITGTLSGGSSRIVRVYQNSSGTFTDISAGITGVSLGSAAWGDYDNDGDLDLLVAGNTGSGKISSVYQNTAGTFSDISAGLTGVDFAAVGWGDYDNDGDLDILLSGRDGGNAKITKVYQNSGGSFSDLGAGLTGVYDGSVAWGDYDGDGDLDILAAGDTGSTRITKIYQNNASTANTTPAAPTNLMATANSTTSITFSWTAPSDTQTATAGLSYNLRVGTTPGGSDVYSTMANSSTGLRRVAARGPIQGTSFTLTDLAPGTTYYWSVQAIDTAFAGGAFATEASATTLRFTDVGALGIAGVFITSVDWGDYDNDGDLDLVVIGRPTSSTIYRNDSGSFTDIGAGLTGVDFGVARWGDYDQDGDLDLFISGRDGSNAPQSKLYRNDSGSFTEVSAGFTSVRYSSAAWGDFDNDGDLDLLLAGRNSGGSDVALIYRNNGDDTFTDIAAGLPGATNGSVAWGDYDADGDLDILLSGTGPSGRVTAVYRNDNGSFTDIAAGLTPVTASSVAWGDYDNDGDLDLLLTGIDGGGGLHTQIYRNDGSDTFTDIAAGLTGVQYGSVAWGDVDNDGDLDALVTGRNAASARITNVYLNNAGTFSDDGSALTGFDFSSVAMGDYDGDGDLDLLIVGRDTGGTSTAKVYRNDTSTANTAPAVPTNLMATASSTTSITFSWTAPSDTETATAGLSYNLRVGTTPGGNDVYSTMANSSTGLRRVAARGPIQGNSFTLTDLAPGTTYYWSVQAIDTAFAGSAFATEDSLALNGAPTAVSVSPNPASSAENTDTSMGLSVGTISVTDDGLGTNTLSLTGTDASSFEIVGNDLRLKANVALNFETKPSYSVTVNVDDSTLGGNPDASTSFTLNLTNVNEPPVINDQMFSIAENSENGTAVGTVLASDPDAMDTLTYSFSGGNVNQAFAINSSTGAITVNKKAGLDFESLATFNLRVAVTDGGGITRKANVTVNVTDVNDPPVIADQMFSIAEHSPNGTNVGTVLASDQDAMESLTYSFSGGNILNVFAINSSTGEITVAKSDRLNFETRAVYDLRVSVTDSHGEIRKATVTVNVLNVNEPPTISPQTFMIAENSPNGTSVGTVVASDPNMADTLSYAITGGNVRQGFAINSSTGELTVNNYRALDYETTPVFNLTIQVTDNHGASKKAVMTISLTDVMELNAGLFATTPALTSFKL
ncbi:hypothetical protein GC163_23825 [bacterium]|nr:hypothetical protein [bacterium]